MPRFRYSKWDGTQVGFDLDADDIFGEMTDELLYHGDLNQALQRLMQRGFTDRNGERIAGMREILERLRQRRREMLDRHDLGGPYEDIAERLREIVDQERAGIDNLVQEAQESGDQRRQEITDEVAAERRMDLDLLPPDLAGQVQTLQQYEWTSSEAREAFDELLDELRSQLMQSYFNQMSAAMSDVSPERLQRMKDMFNDLNQMLETARAGRRHRPRFPGVHGALRRHVPRQPAEPRRAARADGPADGGHAAAAQLDDARSSGPSSQDLAESLLEDMDLRWQVDRLGANLRQAFPQAGGTAQYNFSGSRPAGLRRGRPADEPAGRHGPAREDAVDRHQPRRPGRSRHRPGRGAGRATTRPAPSSSWPAGSPAGRGRPDRPARGPARADPEGLAQDRPERPVRPVLQVDQRPHGPPHQPSRSASATSAPTRPKPTSGATPSTSLSSGRSATPSPARGRGTPVRLSPEDFEVERTESQTSTATVLMLDLSLSMPMRDNFLAAKKVAMALHSLITTQFPRDYLGLVGFGELARELPGSAAARGVLGLRLRHQHAARAAFSPAGCWPGKAGPSRSS